MGLVVQRMEPITALHWNGPTEIGRPECPTEINKLRDVISTSPDGVLFQSGEEKSPNF